MVVVVLALTIAPRHGIATHLTSHSSGLGFHAVQGISSGAGRGRLSVNPYRLPSSSPWLHPSGREVNHPISTGGSHDSGGIGARCTAAASCDPLGFRGSMTPGQLVFRHSNEARDYIVYVEPVTATSSKCGARGRTAPLTHPPANITLPRDRNGVTSSS